MSVSLPSILSDMLYHDDNFGRNFAVAAATSANIRVLEYMGKCEYIPKDRDALSSKYRESRSERPDRDNVVLDAELMDLTHIASAIKNMVYDSYNLLPECKKINIIGVEKSANAYLVAASLLATITSLGFLTPIGGFAVPNRKVDEDQPTFIAFFVLNGLCFFTSLFTAILTISILAPNNRKKTPLDNAKNARYILMVSAVMLTLSVLLAFAAYISATLYFIPHSHGRAIVATIVIVVVFGGMLAISAIIVLALILLLKRQCRPRNFF